ncbi:hypothetical protein BC332_21018 [Capsicum chinense]|nr:hypothetical protein BC332_21018 [Capsicum chinense]
MGRNDGLIVALLFRGKYTFVDNTIPTVGMRFGGNLISFPSIQDLPKSDTRVQVLSPSLARDSSSTLPTFSAVVTRHGSKTDLQIFILVKRLTLRRLWRYKALVIVEGTNAVLVVLVASFYWHPSKSMSVIGITGTNGKTMTSYLVKAILSQKLMAKMVYNGTEAMVMEASSYELALGRSDQVDFDIAVFTNLTRDHLDFHGIKKGYKDAKAKLFAGIVDPTCHHKIVNIDDPNATLFIAQGNPDVPIVTFAIKNKNAVIHLLKFQLCLFETQVLVNTPQGILEISSSLLGRHNIYNFLAAVAVGITVGAPLKDIVKVFGCSGETNGGKRPIMSKIAIEKSDVTILTFDNPKTEDPYHRSLKYAQDYLKYRENNYYPPLPNGHRLFLHDIRRVDVGYVVAMGEEGDMVVVAGKGHEAYNIEGDKNEFFDDREECREALPYVDELHQAGIGRSEFLWRINAGDQI